MIDSQSSTHDNDYWNDFCHRVKADSSWKLYSREYYHALEQHAKHGFKNEQLCLAVRHAVEREQLAVRQSVEWIALNDSMSESNHA